MAEFWEEQSAEDHRDLRKQIVRWSVLFALLIGGLIFAVWWAGSAIHFSASRVEQTTGPTYRVTGIVRDAATGQPVAWAEIADDASGHPPLFHTTADRFGAYELLTIAELHNVRVAGLGYRTATVRVGRAWYVWFPKGSEKLDVALQKEP
jgi:hypothetical protein